MAWYSNLFKEKTNPAQVVIAQQEGYLVHTDSVVGYLTAFDKLESVNRGTNMIVSACTSMDFDVKDSIMLPVVPGIRKKTLDTLLNHRPNPYQSIHEFRTAIFTDFILEGNIFIYFDGVYLYHLPANRVQVYPDPVTFVSGYTYNTIVKFKPEEIIHIKELSSHTLYRGSSRLASADRNIKILFQMLEFQNQFFKNGAVPGMVLYTDNTLSQKAKDATVYNISKKYNPNNGAKSALILDSGLKPMTGLQSTFQEMDFDTSIKTHDVKILTALGIPPILLAGGNNANISPNLRLFYLETILPIVNRYVSALERYFGYDLAPITSSVSALQPDMKELADYHSTLVNAGIVTSNEARLELRLPSMPGGDELRIPANIAGSAANPALGGAPKKPTPVAGPTPSKELDG